MVNAHAIIRVLCYYRVRVGMLLCNKPVIPLYFALCDVLCELNMWVALVKMCHVAVVIDCCF